ncbi:MAG: metallophosphoesterase [Clostridiaceae bacterium]|nr:metallophosphoesterase [Clostridiales bacterium]MDD6877507.1 metallophosphoesterase [Clostridiaceae bacterium]MDY3286183.1 metallophosphoesterase [Eubacteriales bacterium]
MSTLLTLLTVLVIVGLGAFLYARFVEPRILVVENVTIVSENVTDAAEGLRIVQISDVHISDDDHKSKLTDLQKLVNSQEADILVFTGDLFDNFATFEGDLAAAAEAFAGMQARVGKYAVLGNHDYEKGARPAAIRLLEDAGFRVLLGEREILPEQGITITGYDDALYGTHPKNVDLTDAEGFHLVLVHEPDVADMVDASLYDLMLSGHTHGGQVNIPFAEALYLPKMGKNYIKGLFHPGGEDARGVLYVNRGIGESLLPVRFGALPEVTVIELVKK